MVGEPEVDADVEADTEGWRELELERELSEDRVMAAGALLLHMHSGEDPGLPQSEDGEEYEDRTHEYGGCEGEEEETSLGVFKDTEKATVAKQKKGYRGYEAHEEFAEREANREENETPEPSAAAREIVRNYWGLH